MLPLLNGRNSSFYFQFSTMMKMFCNLLNEDIGESDNIMMFSSTAVGLNECLEGNGGCEHLCMDDPVGFHCSCHHGYR